MKILAVCIILLLLIIGFIVWMHPYHWAAMVQPRTFLQITPEEARRTHYSLILDVRSNQEREEKGYYPNSIPVSLDKIKEEVRFLQSDRSVPILVYSNEESQAAMAAQQLYQMGYSKVQYIKESYQAMLPGQPVDLSREDSGFI